MAAVGTRRPRGGGQQKTTIAPCVTLWAPSRLGATVLAGPTASRMLALVALQRCNNASALSLAPFDRRRLDEAPDVVRGGQPCLRARHPTHLSYYHPPLFELMKNLI